MCDRLSALLADENQDVAAAAFELQRLLPACEHGWVFAEHAAAGSSRRGG